MPQRLQSCMIQIMHICMNLTSQQIKDVVDEIDRCRVERGLSISALARNAGVH